MNTVIQSGNTKIFNPWNPKNRELTPSDAIPILKRYGWKGRIKNFNMFAQACCHKSYVDRPEIWQEQTNDDEEVVIAPRPDDCLPLRKCDNEELEYLGDRVLGLVIASYVSKRYPGQGEGFLTRILSRVVNNKQLGKLAKEIGLAPWVILSRHMEEVCDGRNNLRILGSMFEALFGALYLQEDDVGRGLQQCNDFLVKIIERHIDFVQIIIEDTNYKDQLLRKFQALYHVPPRYKEITVVGPPHDRIFTMGVLDPSDKILATSTARNKKVAEQEASRLALEILEPSLTSTTASGIPAHMMDETPATVHLPSPFRLTAAPLIAAGGAGAKTPSSSTTVLPSIALSKPAPIKRIVTHRPKIPVEELE
jgi:ribonuclease-3